MTLSTATDANALAKDSIWIALQRQPKLKVLVQEWVTVLEELGPSLTHLGVLADNSLQWIAVDLAAATLGVPVIPLPGFFTEEQQLAMVTRARISHLVTDCPAQGETLGFVTLNAGVGTDTSLQLMKFPGLRVPTLQGVGKVTFTSGTTGNPKGVCLSIAHQWSVGQALAQATASFGIQRHLCLLPLPVLLENIAGVYAPLIAGAEIIAPPLHTVGLRGATSFDADLCLNMIEQTQAESIILLPQTLYALTQAMDFNDPRLATLKLAAVGGGQVPVALLQLARAKGLPVFEGYGLSECGSVVCLNTPGADKPGSVGRPLTGLSIRVDAKGEVWVRGRTAMGYLNDQAGVGPLSETTEEGGWLATGDLGSLDDEGFLKLDGRVKNLIITSMGRNISPEWPEGRLLATGLIQQAIVFGEGQTSLCAVLTPRSGVTAQQVENAVRQVNSQLPDYARVDHYVLSDQPFAFENGLATSNGRIRRAAVWQKYASRLDSKALKGIQESLGQSA